MKYHENLLGKPAAHRERYDENAAMMGCFRPDPTGLLRRSPLQQIWRDHLLSGVVRANDKYDDALFVMLYPKANEHCRVAVEAYQASLSNTDSFASWSLEDVVERLLTNGAGTWAQRVFDRYCDFSKIERALAMRT